MWSGLLAPFGAVAVATGTLEQRLRFPGQWEETSISSYYNWARYYSPNRGLFYAADPVVRWNLTARPLDHEYVYAGDAPVVSKDPSGLMVCGGCDLNSCLNACAGGAEAWRAYCRSLPGPGLRAGCWALQFAAETACRGWCLLELHVKQGNDEKQ